MILVIGGTFQGKKEYVQNHFKISINEMTDGASCSLEDIYSATCIAHFHEWIKRMLQEERNIQAAVERMMKENPNVILITNELGYGLVPIEKFDREYRETTGRICTKLAAKATEVHRVICGIGQVIKHD